MPVTQETCNRLKLLIENNQPGEILSFFRQWPIGPDDGDIKGLNFQVHAPNVRGASGQTEKPLFAKYKLQGVASQVGFARLSPHPQVAKRGSIFLNVTYADKNPTNEMVPIWWLPWKKTESGGLVKLKINDGDTLNLGIGNFTNMDNPAVFFTAALSGCSIFVYGDPSTPSIYHAGSQNSVEQQLGTKNWGRLGGTSESVWHSLFKGAYHTDIRQLDFKKAILPMDPTAHKTQHPMGEVNKSHYVSERRQDGSIVMPRKGGKSSTTRANQFEEWLENRYQNTCTEIKASPWGCVFGLRYQGKWSFYLQRNATVSYKELVKRRSLFKTRYDIGPMRVNNVVMGIQRFYPEQGSIRWTPHENIQVLVR